MEAKMAETINWRGASGQTYTYYIHELPWRPADKHDGNYIFAKQANGSWLAVYIGQGHVQSRYDAAMDEGCINDKGATHYHVHTKSDEATRKAEESDLIDGNPECKWPKGCNGHD